MMMIRGSLVRLGIPVKIGNAYMSHSTYGHRIIEGWPPLLDPTAADGLGVFHLVHRRISLDTGHSDLVKL